MYEIEKNIPAPSSKGRPYKYPFERMEVGDSFFVPQGNQSSVSTASRKYGARLNRRFSTGRVDGGIRVWRIS